jgi:hypothetical protein
VSSRASLAGAALACAVVLGVSLADHGGVTDAAVTRPAAKVVHVGRHPVRRVRPRRNHRSVTPARVPVVTVLPGSAVRVVPRSFLGLSIEYWGLPLFERHLAAFERVLSLLHVAGDAPLIIRVGGDSADRSLWDPGLRRMPQWVFRLRPDWLRLTNALVRSYSVRLILDLNLVTASPLRAAAWARAAEAKLQPGSIAAFEIGNEPDIYDRPYWLATITHAGQGVAVLPAAISARSYLRAFRAYAVALGRFAPGVPLLGPAVANPGRSLGWISLLATHGRPRLGMLTAHRYPYSACLGRGSQAFPTIARLLSERASAGNAQGMRAGAAIAHRAGLAFRMTELNSVTCGGRPGVSDAFATALWASDAMFELLKAGVDGINIHVRADTVNAAMVPSAGGLRERPLLYGLTLFTRALGVHGRLLSIRIGASSYVHLKVWAVRTARELHVLLVNKDSRSATVDIRRAGTSDATVQRLRAPSAGATSGETLNGQTLAPDGTWTGTPSRELLPPSARGYVLSVPPASAALVSIR